MDKLQKALDQSITLMKKTCDELPWDNKEFYTNYLAQTFYYVRHSTRLLALSAGRLSYEEQQAIHVRFLKHLGEEANHERLAVNDLKHFNLAPSNFKELNSTRFFYETQYYKVEHKDPLALMGYILYLEVLAQNVCPPLSKKLIDIYGKKSATFLHVHGEEDPHHVEEAQKMLSTLPAPSIAIITENLEQSAIAFNLMMKEIKESTPIKWKKTA